MAPNRVINVIFFFKLIFPFFLKLKKLSLAVLANFLFELSQRLLFKFAHVYVFAFLSSSEEKKWKSIGKNIFKAKYVKKKKS